MMSLKLDSINENINKLNKISGFKKRVIEHEKISKDIDECTQYLSKLETSINDITIDATNDMTDDEYHENILFLQKMMNEFSKITNIEEQIVLYKNILQKIKDMDHYLENRKLEIQTIV